MTCACGGRTENIAGFRSALCRCATNWGTLLNGTERPLILKIGNEPNVRCRKRRQGFLIVTRVTTMGELAAAIAHEVNQPLAAIVTNANFCLRQLASATPNSDKLR